MGTAPLLGLSLQGGVPGPASCVAVLAAPRPPLGGSGSRSSSLSESPAESETGTPPLYESSLPLALAAPEALLSPALAPVDQPCSTELLLLRRGAPSEDGASADAPPAVSDAVPACPLSLDSLPPPSDEAPSRSSLPLAGSLQGVTCSSLLLVSGSLSSHAALLALPLPLGLRPCAPARCVM
jgi:hypothetical protein